MAQPLADGGQAHPPRVAGGRLVKVVVARAHDLDAVEPHLLRLCGAGVANRCGVAGVVSGGGGDERGGGGGGVGVGGECGRWQRLMAA